MEHNELKKIWWLWIPLGWAATQFVMEVLPSPARKMLMSEQGPHELLQAAVAGAAMVVALCALRRFPFRQKPWLAVWFGTAALCCLYVAGEEISWGQQLFHWATPEDWARVNDQNETNLHNTSAWFDQKPRLILEIGVTVGGLLLPLLMKYRPSWVPARFAVIYPPPALWVVALINILVRISDAIGAHVVHVTLYERASEVQEIYMYYFVFAYLLALRARVFPAAAPSSPAG